MLQVKDDFDNGHLTVSIDPQTSLEGIKQFETVRKLLMELNCTVLRTPFDQDFVTTDKLAVWYDKARDQQGLDFISGLGYPSVEVIFPLTKKQILIGNRHFKTGLTTPLSARAGKALLRDSIAVWLSLWKNISMQVRII